MKRKEFVKILSLIPIAGFAMKLNDLYALGGSLPSTPLMPAIFFGHGSPMNAIELNEFSQTWRDVVKTIPTPNAILCISAHWETKGTKITAMPTPEHFQPLLYILALQQEKENPSFFNDKAMMGSISMTGVIIS